MKNSRISLCIVSLMLAVFLSGSAPRATAALDTREKAETVVMLTSTPWTFKTEKWTEVREFKSNGLFTTVGKPKESGKWLIYNDTLLLNFTDGHQDTLTLPLYTKNTAGLASSGAKMTASQGAATAASGTPKPVSKTVKTTNLPDGSAAFGTTSPN